jgi:hypothetical protein
MKLGNKLGNALALRHVRESLCHQATATFSPGRQKSEVPLRMLIAG